MKDHVALVIKDNSGKILFTKRSTKKKTIPGVWSFASGTVETDENIFTTAKREAEEELGVTIVPERVLAEKEFSEFSVKLHFVLAHIQKGNAYARDLNEVEEVRWLSFTDFFKQFKDAQIGHGLIWFRQNPEIWKDI